MTNEQPPVLVTGGAGFIASHIIAALIDHGHRVRTTARSLDREPQVREQLARLGADPGDRLELFAADLLDDAGWAAAVEGTDYVVHVASPVMPGHVENEDDVIVPAREGTLRVLRAAQGAGVKRVVLTSAFHAIGFGWGRTDHTFTDEDWSPLDGPGMDAYGRSKVLAERAAWSFARESGMELVALNPVAVLGPVVSSSVTGGNAIVRRILSGQLDSYPNLWIPIVDVRDVAVAHVLAMTTADAAGQRFIVGSGDGLKLEEIGAILRAHLGDRASHVTTKTTPSAAIRAAAESNPALRGLADDVDIVKRIDASKIRRVLGWQSRPLDETVVDAAVSMLDLGVVPPAAH
ncbi:Nucleoside-diphosphate-sugar epimerase [Microbacterium sp. cf046]|uniref:NAD-dependent epimerase/dehydratase family protein n=1 Tax=Microbacterium sp. cf046 TaxID=1761803 RepID=UPI0008E984E5|nr:NAD-dependent epimerase/dehydratase family protein [Microbacterium sp. cf046]SFR85790.1 Nucleoside-diphosphate-sugar epimerase [Microbacterium sp. cf046]